MQNLRKFFFDVLELDINKTASHKTCLPLKKNQSLCFSLDFDLNKDLYTQLILYINYFPFIQFEKINKKQFEYILKFFPEFGKKPVPFKVVVDNNFKDLTYSYSDDLVYTFMDFCYNQDHINIPIEKISRGKT